MKLARCVGLVVLAAAGCGGTEATGPPPAEPAPALPAPPEPAPEPATGYGDGPSCEDGRREWLSANPARGQEPPEEHEEAIKEQLNRGTYLNDCGVAPSSAVEICAAIADAAAVGVTVTLDPGERPEADCVADQVRRMEFPDHTEMTVATTTFKPSL